MKRAEEYLKDFITEPNFEQIEELIKQAQIDTIEETCRVCAENADLTYVECEWEIPEGAISTGDPEYGYHYVDTIKIFNVTDKLKKELE